MSSQQRLADFLGKDGIGQVKEVSQHDLILLVLRTLVDLLHRINEALKVLLSERLLFDLSTGATCDQATTLSDFVIQALQEFLVAFSDLIVFVNEVKVESIIVDSGDVLEVVRCLSDLLHRLVP